MGVILKYYKFQIDHQRPKQTWTMLWRVHTMRCVLTCNQNIVGTRTPSVSHNFASGRAMDLELCSDQWKVALSCLAASGVAY